MSVVFDYIFKHSYYQNVKSTFWEAQNVYSKAYRLWEKEQTVFIGDDYESKQYVYENFSEIKSIAACIEKADNFLCQSRKAVEWLFYHALKLRSIPTLGIAEYKFISNNAIQINAYASKLQEYARIITDNKEAVGRFLNHSTANHTFEEINEIVSSKDKIKEIGTVLKKAHTCKDRYPLAWKHFFNGRTISKISIEELRSINPSLYSKTQSHFEDYEYLVKYEKRAVNRFLGTMSKEHSFEEIEKIAEAKDQIKLYGDILRKAYQCKDTYPLTWEAFSKGRTMSKIPMDELKLVEPDAFARKEMFLPVFTRHENLCKLIMGKEDYDLLDFSNETAAKECDCIQYLKIQFNGTSDLNAEVHIEGDELKRAILDSTRYGKDVHFVDEFTVSEFYDLRKEADELELGFDSIVEKTKDNYAAIKAFNKEKSGKEVVYIQNYIPASTKGSPLYNYIEAYQKQKETRGKARQISVNYPLGFAALFDSNINFDNCELSLAKRIIDSEQLIKSRDYKEIEKKRKREEEERKAVQKRELENCVSNWNCIGYSLHYNYLLRYFPTTCNFDATEDEWADRWLVWNFKNTPGKTSSIQHEQALGNLLPRLTRMLNNTFGEKLQLLTLVCIPGSSAEKTEARYKVFSNRLCSMTGMGNAYNHINVIRCGEEKKFGGQGIETSNLSFDADFFANKNVIIFDDIITKGESMLRFKRKLESLGAIVIAGVSIGKTTHER